MNYQDVCKLIPKEYRVEILELNMIQQAVGIPGDNSMHYLYNIWRTFIEPTIGDCSLCYQRVLENFRKMQQTLIDMNVTEGLLDAIDNK